MKGTFGIASSINGSAFSAALGRFCIAVYRSVTALASVVVSSSLHGTIRLRTPGCANARPPWCCLRVQSSRGVSRDIQPAGTS